MRFDPRKCYIAAVGLLAFSYSGTTVWLLKIGVPTGPANIVIKSFIIGLFLITLLSTLSQPNRTFRALFPVLVLLILYAHRLLYDVLIRDITPGEQTHSYVLGYFFGLTLLPILVIGGAVKKSDIRLIDDWIFVLLLLANISILVHVLTSDLGSLLELFAGRIEVEGATEGTAVLNPIGIGLTGACLAAMAMGRLTIFGGRGGGWIFLHFLILTLGIINILMAASRGPALAFLACLSVVLVSMCLQNRITTARNALLRPVTWLYLIILTFSIATLISREDIPIFLVDRFTTFLDERLTGVSEARDVIQAAAWQDFLGSPIYGSSYVVSFERSSAHSIFYEALISAGIFGAVAITWAISRLAWGIWRAIRGDAGPHGFPLALVGICLLVLQFTSGSIGQSPEFWVFLSLLVLLTERPARTSLPVREPSSIDLERRISIPRASWGQKIRSPSTPPY